MKVDGNIHMVCNMNCVNVGDAGSCLVGTRSAVRLRHSTSTLTPNSSPSTSQHLHLQMDSWYTTWSAAGRGWSMQSIDEKLHCARNCCAKSGLSSSITNLRERWLTNYGHVASIKIWIHGGFWHERKWCLLLATGRDTRTTSCSWKWSVLLGLLDCTVWVQLFCIIEMAGQVMRMRCTGHRESDECDC